MLTDCPLTPSDATLRSEQRFETRLPAVVGAVESTFSAQLFDLSRGGALAEAVLPPAEGDAVRLCIDRFEIDAIVMWTERRRFGLQFLQPLRATELLLLLGRSRAAGAVRASTPCFARS